MAREIKPSLYHDSIVVDCLNGSALTPEIIARWRASGVTAVNLTAVEIGHEFPAAVKDLAHVAETVQRHHADLLLARTPDDIRLAKETDRVAIVLGLQDLEPIGRELSSLRTLFDLGVRIAQLTHNRQNYIGTGCTEADSGLTKFGGRVVEEMNRLGMIVDLSHCGPQTTLDAIECSGMPVMCSHANPRVISDSPRNKSDQIIRKLADGGGVIGIACWAPIVYRGNGKRPTLADVLDCFDYALRLAGPNDVAIGSDLCEGIHATSETWAPIYGPRGTYPDVTGSLGDWYGFDTVYAEGLETATQLPAVAEGLLERGHGESTVRKVLGENFLRLLAEVTGR